MTIYGIGGAIAIALLVAIVVMAGGSIVPNLGGDDDEPATDTGYPLVDDNGEVDPKIYAELAGVIGTEKWIDWRYGPAADAAATDAEAEEPPSTDLDLGDGIDHTYQYGDDSAANTIHNVQGQVGFVSDDAAHPGVDRITTMETTNSSLGFAPRPGGRLSQDAAEVELTDGSTAKCLGDADLGQLVAMDRADGPGFAAQSVLAFSSGAIATAGVSGAQGGTCVQLPSGQVPTSVAVSPANEFALVTTWDPENVTGHVAVIALAGKPGTYSSNWPNLYPGLPNPGHFGFAKLLGSVELDIKAPTSITVGTDFTGDKAADRTQADLSNVDLRGGYADDIASTGFAAVASKAEKTVDMIDLKPLLTAVSATYFEGDPGVYATPGTDEGAWPPTFDAQPDYAPTLAGTVSMDAEPGAVAAIGQTAYVSDAGGKMFSFNASDPASATETGSVDLAGAAVCLAPTNDGKQLLATSRDDQSVSWITPSDSGGSVDRTLQDSRITDPTCAEDSAD
ncbi:MAG: hypothetical protein ACRD0P_23390, partial [Stackebrandtia sp.]